MKNEKWYPMLDDGGENGGPHPIIHALKQGGKIEKIVIGEDWFDDHCQCFNITAIVNGKEYKYSDWWLSQRGVQMYHQSECDGQKAEKQRSEVKKHILANWMSE